MQKALPFISWRLRCLQDTAAAFFLLPARIFIYQYSHDATVSLISSYSEPFFRLSVPSKCRSLAFIFVFQPFLPAASTVVLPQSRIYLRTPVRFPSHQYHHDAVVSLISSYSNLLSGTAALSCFNLKMIGGMIGRESK